MKKKDYTQVMINELTILRKTVIHEPCGNIEYESTKRLYRSLYYLFNKTHK